MDLTRVINDFNNPKKFRQLCIALYLIIVVINLFFLKLPYRIIADEPSYLELSHIVAYGEDFNDGWSLRSYFFPAVLSLSQIPNKIFGLTSPEEKILTFRIFIILFATLIFWATYLLGKELFSRKVGIIAGVFISLTNTWISNSLHVMMDTIVTVFITFSLYFFIKGFRQPEKMSYIAISAIAFGCAVMTKFAAGVFLFSYMLLVYYLTNDNVVRKRNIALFVIFSIVMFVIYCLIDLFTFGEIFLTFKRFLEFNFIDKTFTKYSPWGSSRTPLTMRGQFLTTVIPPAIFFFMVLGLIKTFNKDKTLFFALVPFTLVFFISFYVEGARYFLPIMPFAFILAVAGLLNSHYYASELLLKLKTKKEPIAILILVVSSFCLALFVEKSVLFSTLPNSIYLGYIQALSFWSLVVISLGIYLLAWLASTLILSILSKTPFRSNLFIDALSYAPSIFLTLLIFSDRLSYNIVLALSTVSLILVSKMFFFQKLFRKVSLTATTLGLLIFFHLPLGLIEPFIKGTNTSYDVGILLKEEIQKSSKKVRIGIVGSIAFPKFFFEPHQIHKFKHYNNPEIIKRGLSDGWDYLLISKKFRDLFYKELKQNNYIELSSIRSTRAYCFKKQFSQLEGLLVN